MKALILRWILTWVTWALSSMSFLVTEILWIVYFSGLVWRQQAGTRQHSLFSSLKISTRLQTKQASCRVFADQPVYFLGPRLQLQSSRTLVDIRASTSVCRILYYCYGWREQSKSFDRWVWCYFFMFIAHFHVFFGFNQLNKNPFRSTKSQWLMCWKVLLFSAV